MATAGKKRPTPDAHLCGPARGTLVFKCSQDYWAHPSLHTLCRASLATLKMSWATLKRKEGGGGVTEEEGENREDPAPPPPPPEKKVVGVGGGREGVVEGGGAERKGNISANSVRSTVTLSANPEHRFVAPFVQRSYIASLL